MKMKKWFAALLILMLLIPAIAMAAQWNDVLEGLNAGGVYESGGVKAALTKENDKATVEVTGGTLKFDEMGMLECWPGAAQTEYVFTDCKLDFSASYIAPVYTWGGSVMLRFEGGASMTDMISFAVSGGTENAVINHTQGNLGPITVNIDGPAKLAMEGIDPKKTELSVYASLTSPQTPDIAAVEAVMREAYAGLTLDGALLSPADVYESLVQVTDGSWFYAFYQGKYDAGSDAWTFKED